MKDIKIHAALQIVRRVAVMLMLLVLCSGMTALAENSEKVVDRADLLTDKQEAKLQEQFEKIAEKYQCDVALLTVNSCNTTDFQKYTKDYYLDNDYGYGSDKNGIILMITMAERKFQLTTTGEAENIFTNYGLQVIDDQITPDLSDGDYYDAFKKYGKLVEKFIKEAEKGQPYDSNHTFKEPMPIGKRLLISLVAGVVLAIAVVLVLLGQLKSVGIEKEAQEYVRKDSFHVTRSNDLYLYTTRSRRKIERDRDSRSGSGGSSGSSSGGHTGSF